MGVGPSLLLPVWVIPFWVTWFSVSLCSQFVIPAPNSCSELLTCLSSQAELFISPKIHSSPDQEKQPHFSKLIKENMSDAIGTLLSPISSSQQALSVCLQNPSPIQLCCPSCSLDFAAPLTSPHEPCKHLLITVPPTIPPICSPHSSHRSFQIRHHFPT